MKKPVLKGLLETALYVADLKRSFEFYERIFQFKTLFSNERMHALQVPGLQVLLLFLKGASSMGTTLAYGEVPAHDGNGELHVAFSIEKNELKQWENWLLKHEVPIESRVNWPKGGISLYFRDPDRHSIELATPGLWTFTEP